MKDKVYPSSTVVPYHNKFIWANLNVDLQAVRKVMPKFQVQGVPYIVILSPDGQLLGINRGLIKSEAFVALMDRALAKPGATKVVAKTPPPTKTVTPNSTPKPAPTTTGSKPKSIFKNR